MVAEPKKRIVRKSARDVLLGLDSVITITEVSHYMNISRQLASVYLNRWQNAGHIQMFGSGVYFNTTKDPSGVDGNLGVALERLLGKAFMVIGGSAVYHGGWTTQVHNHIEVATPVYRGSMSVPKTACGVTIVGRTETRFNAMKKHILPESSGWEGVPVLDPAAAIVDICIAEERRVNGSVSAARDVAYVPVDEIDPDYIDEEDVARIGDIAEAMGSHAYAARDRISQYRNALSNSAEFGMQF